MINFGNSTEKWYNKTSAPSSWNFYDLTVSIANGNIVALYSQTYKAHFVTSIDGVANSGEFYWTLWLYCDKEKAWATSSVGADGIKLINGETVAWAYEVPYSSPLAGSTTVSSCS